MAKFVYRMQNILNIKQKLETQAKMTYSLANQKYLEQQKILQEYMVRRVGYEQHWKKLMQGKFKSAGSRTCAGRCKCHENDCQTTDGRSPQGGKRTGRCQKPLKNRDAGTKGSGKIEEKAFEEFKQELAEAETKEIDELVSYTYNKGEQGE